MSDEEFLAAVNSASHHGVAHINNETVTLAWVRPAGDRARREWVGPDRKPLPA